MDVGCSTSGAPERHVRSSVDSSADCFVTIGIERARFKCGHMDSFKQLDAGRPDVRVRPVSASSHPKTAQRLFELWGSINRKALAQGSFSWYFDILDILVSLSKYLSLIFIIDSSS
jgi:hypothetical protein